MWHLIVIASDSAGSGAIVVCAGVVAAGRGRRGALGVFAPKRRGVG